MNCRISVLIIVFSLFSCDKEKGKSIAIGVEDNYLVEAEDLKLLINQKNIKLIDFRKKEFYDEEHIDGALNIWRTDIEDNSYPYQGVMANKTQIEMLFGKLGIKTDDTVIVYDDNGLCEASRLWWILQNYDFKNIKMLHGGISAWKSNNGKVTADLPEVNANVFRLAEKPSMQYYISKDKVKEALKDDIVILDTRTRDEFTGKRKKQGATKSGRLPNSIHMDWAEAVNYNGDMRIKPLEELELIYKNLKIKKDDPIIVYCHSGVRSAHTTFVLTQLLGYKNVKNYDGSWTEWSYFNDLPFESDSRILIKN